MSNFLYWFTVCYLFIGGVFFLAKVLSYYLTMRMANKNKKKLDKNLIFVAEKLQIPIDEARETLYKNMNYISDNPATWAITNIFLWPIIIFPMDFRNKK